MLWTFDSDYLAYDEAVQAAAAAITADPSRFPALRTLKATGLRLHTRWWKRPEYLPEVGPLLRAAGIALVDARGVAWRPEMEDEAERAEEAGACRTSLSD